MSTLSSVMTEGICQAWENTWRATISNKTG
jgi:hypothetical protein